MPACPIQGEACQAISAELRLDARFGVDPQSAWPLIEYYRALGFSVHTSVTQGDCGPDSYVALDGGSSMSGFLEEVAL